MKEKKRVAEQGTGQASSRRRVRSKVGTCPFLDHNVILKHRVLPLTRFVLDSDLSSSEIIFLYFSNSVE